MSKFYMMIGVSGSGKSTKAKEIAKQENAIIFSSDEIRAELYGDENIQGNGSEVFSLLHKRLYKALEENKNVIYDATNTSAKRRKSFLKSIDKYNCDKIAVYVLTSYEDCVKRNNMRDRHVPEDVIKRQYLNLQAPSTQEGFDRVIIIN